MTVVLTLSACAETVRCPDDEVFDDEGRCGPIPDAGPRDATSDG